MFFPHKEKMDNENVSYYDNDFLLGDWKKEALITQKLLQIKEPVINEEGEAASWQTFFSSHSTGQIYKPRRYICKEFKNYLSASHIQSVLEVGCGYGCTMFPLLEQYSFHYVATDYATKALEILQEHPLYIPSRTLCEPWDITLPPPERLLSIDSLGNQMILCIFALSAVQPQSHAQSFEHMKQLLLYAKQKDDEAIRDNKDTCNREYCILFRDYGEYDMTMFRHKIRYHEYGYQRHDGTYCYYFSEEYLRNLVTSVGLQVKELSYATVINKNRKTKQNLHRVFMHGVFALSDI